MLKEAPRGICSDRLTLSIPHFLIKIKENYDSFIKEFHKSPRKQGGGEIFPPDKGGRGVCSFPPDKGGSGGSGGFLKEQQDMLKKKSAACQKQTAPLK